MKRIAICALTLLLMGAGSVAAQIVVGPPDDTTVIADTSGSTTGQLIGDEFLPSYLANTTGAGNVSMSGLDCSGFPTICFYVDVLDSLGATIPGLTADSFCVYQDGTQIDSFTVQQLDADSCVTSVCLVVDVSGSMAEDNRLDSTKAAMHRFVDNMDPFDLLGKLFLLPLWRLFPSQVVLPRRSASPVTPPHCMLRLTDLAPAALLLHSTVSGAVSI